MDHMISSTCINDPICFNVSWFVYCFSWENCWMWNGIWNGKWGKTRNLTWKIIDVIGSRCTQCQRLWSVPLVFKQGDCCEVEDWVVSPTGCEFRKAKSCSHWDLETGHCGVEITNSSIDWLGFVVPKPATWLQETWLAMDLFLNLKPGGNPCSL